MKRMLASTPAWALLAAIIPLAFYSLTLCPTVYCGDGGELALAATNLEISHPPGYPLLTNVGHLCTMLLSFARPIVALNLLSALFAAAAAGLLFLAITMTLNARPILSRLIALALSVMFALGQTLWSVATGYEVYSLGAMLTALAIFLFLKFHVSLQKRFLFLGSYVLGLALCNHLSVGSLGPAWLILILCHRRELTVRDYLCALILLILPLSFYNYLYVRSAFDLVLAWYDPHSLAGLKQQIFAETYQTYLAKLRFVDLPPYLRQLWQLFSTEFVLPTTLLALPGLYLQFKRDRWVALMLVSIVAANWILNFSYTIPDIAPYFLPSIVVVTIWIGEFLFAVATQSRWLSRIAVIVALLLASTTAVGNYARSDIGKRRGAEEYAQDLFERVPSGGILFCGSDNSMFPTLYLHYAEHYRPDCQVYGLLPTLTRLRHDLGLDSASGGWNKFPDLLEYAIAHSDRPMVFAREPMQITNDFKTIVPTLRANGLVYYLDSAAQVTPSQLHFDWRNIPPLYDPKETAMYAVYYLVNAETMAQDGGRQSENHLKTAVDIVTKTHNSVYISALASYFVTVNNLPLARKTIESALSRPGIRFDERLRLLTPLGKIYLLTGDVEKAGAVLNEAIRMDPGNSEAKFHLLAIDAAIAVGNKRWQDAIATYRRMLDLSPEQREVNLQLGILYHQVGDTAMARQMLNICLQDNYESDQVQKLLERF